MLADYAVPEVLCGLGHCLAVETNLDSTELFVAMGNVKVDLWGTISTAA